MDFRLTIGSLLAFLIVTLLLHEAHEMAHHVSGWIVCGCHGTRDFLYWQLCNDCHSSFVSIVTGFAGPLVTYFFMWCGFVLLHPSNNIGKKQTGFVLVMAALPLPRLLGAAGRGGDEINTMRRVFDEQEVFKGAAVIAGGLIVLLLSIPPLWRAFRSIKNKQRLLIFLAFLVLPWLLDDLVITRLLQGYLTKTGILMEPVYFGIPVLVIVWDILLLAGFLMRRKYLKNGS
jgi:uncharacterized membrane protein